MKTLRALPTDCEACGEKMTEAASCSANESVEILTGEFLPGVPYEDLGHQSHDCFVEPGGFHHPGCDMERCPNYERVELARFLEEDADRIKAYLGENMKLLKAMES